MSIQNSIDRIIAAVTKAHQAVEDMGGNTAVPYLVENLEAAIKTIPKATSPVLQSKYVTPTESKQEVTADSGYDGLEKVTVNAIPSNYITPSGTKSITENGTYDVKTYDSVNVNVPTSGGGDIDALLSGEITALDSTVTTITSYACRGRKKLKTVNLPNVTYIQPYGFTECTVLESVNAPKLSTLRGYTFNKCSALEKIVFPKLTSLSEHAFNSCTALTFADFAIATSIGTSAFANSGITALVLRKNSVVSLGNVNALNGTPIKSGTGYIYVPSALLDDYKSATNWSSFSAQFRAIESYTVDGTITGEFDQSKI